MSPPDAPPPSPRPPLRPDAEATAGWLNSLVFHWIHPLILEGRRQTLQEHHLPPLVPADQAATLAPLFHDAYHRLASADLRREHLARATPASPAPPPLPRAPGLLTRLAECIPPRFASRTARALLPVTGLPFLLAAAWKPVWLAASVAQVYAIRALVQHVSAQADARAAPAARWAYLPVVLAMAATAQLASLSSHATFFSSMRAGMRARAAVSAEIYRKTLRLSAPALAKTTEGEMGNLLLNDTQRILDSYSYFHFCWLGFLEIAVVSGLLAVDLGPSAAFGVLTLLLLVPAQISFSSLVSRARTRVATHADVRVQKMGELLSGIRIVKLAAWEPHFHSVITSLRAREVTHLRVGAVLRALNAALFFAAPAIVSLATFTAYTIIFRRTLTPALTFSSLAYFSIISRVLTLMPLGWLATSEASVANRRMDKFFDLEELPSIPDDVRLDVSNVLPPPTPASTVPHISRDNHDIDLRIDEDTSSADNPSIPDIDHDDSPGASHSTARILTERAQFSYAQQDSTGASNGLATVLTDVSISVTDGTLLTIVGPVGSGKSSLLLGILGEMLCTSGAVCTYGSVAYCAQQPWIVNASLRENITMFGDEDDSFDAEWYKKVVDACCLRPDIDALPAGDRTEIGERGINLSGGQKARVGLARAVYSKADIYLFDDPLSAVDAAVSAALSKAVFGPEGLLSERAQVIVTHQLQILPLSSTVIVLGGGTVDHSGTYEDLRAGGVEFSGFSGAEEDLDRERSLAALENEEVEIDRNAIRREERLQKLLRDANVDVTSVDFKKEPSTAEELRIERKVAALNAVDGDDEDIQSRMGGQREGELHSEPNGDLVVDEDRRVGRVTGGVYKAYVKAGGGYLALFAVLLAFSSAQAVRQVSEWWLAQWSTYRFTDSMAPSDPDVLFDENRFYSLIFFALAGGTGILTLLRAALFAERTMAASKKLHNNLLARVLHAKPSFFDTNPIGRILNRFSKDIDQMDLMLPMTSQDFLQISFAALGALATISWILPWFLIPLVPILGSFLFLQRMYKMCSRELKRIDGVSRSPIYSQFVETAIGLATVRAFNADGSFSSVFSRRIDRNHRAYHIFSCAGRWLGVRLDTLTSLVVFFTSLVVLIVSPTLDPGLAGVALTQSILMTGAFQWGVRQAAETENLFTSVERVATMATETPVEKPYKIPEKEPSQEWPTDGVVAFNNVVLKYRPELDPALQDLSFKSKGRERIGIVGRTGSGKSSLFVALFRMVELTAGTITIDDVDISEIGLHDLRSRIAIVPQDPVLFNGTIRSNLDPTGAFNDAQLWDALRRVHMSCAIQGIGGSLDDDGHGLDLIVHEKGSNFSAGERQLLSLARAILSGVKIVVLDEASASLDNYTDMLIQKTMREQLSDRTVLTIAHRLATIADSDRVLVIDAGEAVEFDTPLSLISRGGYFARLVEETGPVESTILKAIIAEASSSSKDKK